MDNSDVQYSNTAVYPSSGIPGFGNPFEQQAAILPRSLETLPIGMEHSKHEDNSVATAEPALISASLREIIKMIHPSLAYGEPRGYGAGT